MRSWLFLPILACFSTATLPLCRAQVVTVVETRANGSALLEHSQAAFAAATPGGKGTEIRVLDDKPLQRMDGFGASLTGSSAALLMKLPATDRDAIMHELFDPAGPLGITLLRQPFGASDFSAHGNYSYDDVPAGQSDPTLAHFSVAPDEADLFPLLREAVHIDPQVRLLVLPWSAPAWMKTTHTMNGGALDDRYITAYAHYLARAVEAFAQQGLPVYSLALQNEPENENLTYPTELMPAKQELALAADTRPLLRADGRPTLLMGYEHNWSDVQYPNALLDDPRHLFDGISFHCYRGDESAQRAVLLAHPHASVWFTECSGINRTDFAGDLMWQARHLLLGAPLNGARSVMLWNLVLDPNGNPHNGGCEGCRALLTLRTRDGKPSWSRNVEFYLLAHAAPFVHPDAQMLETTLGGGAGLLATAYRNVDGTFAVLLLNQSPADQDIRLSTGTVELARKLPARSLTTLTWGTPVPAVREGMYRLGLDGGQCLTAVPGAPVPARTACSGEPAQLWSVSRLSGNRFEVRNVGTTQDLSADASGSAHLLAVDGDHVAPVFLLPQGEGACLAASEKGGCAGRPQWTFLPSLADKLD